MERLKCQLDSPEEQQSSKSDKTNWNSHNELERGNAVRTFKGIKFVEQ